MAKTDIYQTRLRSSGLVGVDELKKPITIIGAGSIGSFSALALAKLGCTNITVIDFDKVSDVNVGCQIYGSDYIGCDKVDALEEILEDVTDIKITPLCKKWDGEGITPIVISAVDKIETRQAIWETIKTSGAIDWYIDGRMAGEYMHIFIVNMANKQERDTYEKSLHPKAVEQLSCSTRSVVYNTLMIGGLIANMVKRIAKKETPPREIIFDIPSLQLLSTTP